jgi:hypothetical protein
VGRPRDFDVVTDNSGSREPGITDLPPGLADDLSSEQSISADVESGRAGMVRASIVFPDYPQLNDHAAYLSSSDLRLIVGQTVGPSGVAVDISTQSID